MRQLFIAVFCALFTLPAMAAEITANVHGMSCVACADAISAALEENPAIEKVTVNVDSGKVMISTKPGMEISDADLTATIEKLGYDVQLIQHAPPSLPDFSLNNSM